MAIKPTLQDLGYRFNENGELRKIKDGSPFIYTNQTDYTRVGNAMTAEVYDILQSSCTLEKIDVPVKVESEDGAVVDFCGFVFTSPKFQEKSTILVIIHGSGAVRAGQWSRRYGELYHAQSVANPAFGSVWKGCRVGEVAYWLILNEGLDVGSQIPYIRRALANDWGIIVCNTNTDEEIHDYARRHLCAVYEQLLKDSSGQRIFVVAHSRGGVDIAHALPYFKNETRFEVVCLTDSLNFELPRCSSTENSAGGTVFLNWRANSDLQKAALAEEDLLGLYPRIQQLYAGTTEHERSCHTAFESVFYVLEHWTKKQNLAKLLVEASGLTSVGVTET